MKPHDAKPERNYFLDEFLPLFIGMALGSLIFDALCRWFR